MAEKVGQFFKLNTGAKMPSIGLGTWQIQTDQVDQVLETAINLGYRHLDCAPVYKNEKEIGLALKKIFEKNVVKREDVFVGSKLWNADHAPEDVHLALERTLQDLQLDYIDLYLIHWPVRLKKGAPINKPEGLIPADLVSTWKAMEALYDSGKARAIGVCNFSTKKLKDLIDIARVPPAVNQVECHPLWQQKKLRSFCESNDVHLSAYSPLGSPGTPWIKSSGNVLENPVLISVAEKLGKSAAQVAIRWALQMGCSVLPKSANEERIRENLDVFDWGIPDELLAKFDEIEQVRLVKAEFFVGENGPYKSLQEFWDGEV